MNDSILITIRNCLGLKNVNVFDEDLILFINSALATMKQIGVTKSLFRITGEDETWSDFLQEKSLFEMVKEFVFIKVRMMFDPPNSSYVMQSLKEESEELKWRINAEVEEGEFDERNKSK